MRPTLTWLTDHRVGLGWPCRSCPTSGRRQPSPSSADEAPGQLGESHGLPTKRRPYQPGEPRMTWAVPTNVCLPTRASRPDTQRTKRSPQLALPRPRRVGREACPDNGVMQSSWRSSRRPSSFDEICQATHEYAFGQRPLFGMSACWRPAARRLIGQFCVHEGWLHGVPAAAPNGGSRAFSEQSM